MEQAKKTTGASRRNAQARRESIISAARSLFAKHGFHGTGMAQIARVSKVLVGQIYRDFAGKEDLIAAIVERDVSELLNDPDLAAAMETSEEEQLNNWLRRFISRELDVESRNVLADILSEATRNPKVAIILSEGYNRLRNSIAEAVLVWAPSAEGQAGRLELADLILASAGAIQNRQIYGVPISEGIIDTFIGLVERKVAELSHAA